MAEGKSSVHQVRKDNHFAKMFRDGMLGEKLMDSIEAPDGPIWELVKSIVIPRLNETAIDRTNYTLSEIVELVKTHLDALKDTICVTRVAPFYKDIIVDNKDDILAALRQLLENIIGDRTLPTSLPTRPQRPTVFPGSPTRRP